MWFSQKCMYLFTISAITPVYTLQAQVTICRQVVASTQSYAWIDSACNRLVLEIPDTHTHTQTGSNKHTTDSPQIYTQIITNSMSMKSSSKASDTCFFSFLPCFCSTPRQQVIPGMPHGGRASPSAALSPVLAAPAEGWNGSAPWRHGWKVMKSLENMGKHGKTWENNHGNHEILETSGKLFLVCVFVCAFFIPDYS